MKTVYIIVLVTYDYFRFQENLAIALALKDARKKAKLYAVRNRLGEPIDNAKKSDDLDCCQTPHIWIQRMRTAKR